MNLERILHWRLRPANTAGRPAVIDRTNPTNESAPAPFRPLPSTELPEWAAPAARATADQADSYAQPETASKGAAHGALSAPLLQAFFAENFFGLGVHNGANLRTLEALEQGKSEISAKFQNVLARLCQERQGRVNRLRDKELETAGVCATTTQRLGLAAEAAQKDVDALIEQIELAGSHVGWVAEPLHRYQMGFRKGMTDALAYDLLGR